MTITDDINIFIKKCVKKNVMTYDAMPCDIKKMIFKKRYEIMKDDKYKKCYNKVINELNDINKIMWSYAGHHWEEYGNDDLYINFMDNKMTMKDLITFNDNDGDIECMIDDINDTLTNMLAEDDEFKNYKWSIDNNERFYKIFLYMLYNHIKHSF